MPLPGILSSKLLLFPAVWVAEMMGLNGRVLEDQEAQEKYNYIDAHVDMYETQGDV
jgi:hypothetical protein